MTTKEQKLIPITYEWMSNQEADLEDGRYKDTNLCIIYSEGKFIIGGYGPGKSSLARKINRLQKKGLTPLQVVDTLGKESEAWKEKQAEKELA